MFRTLMLSLILSLAPMATLAANTVFSCTMRDGKVIELTRNGNFYQYRFGLPDIPELIFKNSREKVISNSEEFYGVSDDGFKITAYVMDGGQYNYRVFNVTFDDGSEMSGVRIEDGFKEVDGLLCAPEYSLYTNWH